MLEAGAEKGAEVGGAEGVLEAGAEKGAEVGAVEGISGVWGGGLDRGTDGGTDGDTYGDTSLARGEVPRDGDLGTQSNSRYPHAYAAADPTPLPTADPAPVADPNATPNAAPASDAPADPNAAPHSNRPIDPNADANGHPSGTELLASRGSDSTFLGNRDPAAGSGQRWGADRWERDAWERESWDGARHWERRWRGGRRRDRMDDELEAREKERREAEEELAKPLYVIGRSMFETDGIPSHWAAECNKWTDEVRRGWGGVLEDLFLYWLRACTLGNPKDAHKSKNKL